jgi:hypothetical protein
LGTEEQLILLSAGTAARREAMGTRLEQLGDAVDWQQLAALLYNSRLLPTLGPRIVELTGDRATDRFRRAVTGALESGRRQGALLQLLGERVMDALAEAGIRSTALKGPKLSEALYGDPGRRISSDIDLLVHPDQLCEAVGVVCELGYRAPVDAVGDSGLPLLHFVLVHERGELPPIELHWRIHWYESRFASDRLLPPNGDCLDAWRPARIDELTALLLFYARDGFIGLRHATDLGTWWDAFGTSLTPGAIDESIGAYSELEPALVAAATAARMTVGIPSARLTSGGFELGLRGRIAVRLADPCPHASEAQLYADVGLIDGLLTPRQGLWAFVRRQMTPPAYMVRERTSPTWRRRVGSTTGHSVRVLIRYGMALIRLLHVRPLSDACMRTFM